MAELLPPEAAHRGISRLQVALENQVVEVEKVEGEVKDREDINMKLALLCFLPQPTPRTPHQLCRRLKNKEIGRLMTSQRVTDGLEVYERLSYIDIYGSREDYLKVLHRPSLGLLVRMFELATLWPVGDFKMSEEIGEKIGRRAKAIYSPLADLFGYRRLAGDLYLVHYYYNDRERYEEVMEILNYMKDKIESTARCVEAMLKSIEEEMKKRNYQFRIKMRTKKHPGKIMEKSERYERKGLMVEQTVQLLHDHVAATLILEKKGRREVTQDRQNWFNEVANIVRRVVKGGLRCKIKREDMISNPKPNGYQSLHLDIEVKDPRYCNFEIIIRNRQMENYAERGGAAHHLYKGGNSGISRQVAEHYHDVLARRAGKRRKPISHNFSYKVVIKRGEKVEERKVSLREGALVGEALLLSGVDLTQPIKANHSLLQPAQKSGKVEVIDGGKAVGRAILEILARQARTPGARKRAEELLRKVNKRK